MHPGRCKCPICKQQILEFEQAKDRVKGLEKFLNRPKIKKLSKQERSDREINNLKIEIAQLKEYIKQLEKIAKY
jgi:uncharacterized Zn finger protein (UPF0148 family)